MTSYKVEFLTNALSVDGALRWVSNAYRYRNALEASRHFDYLRGIGAPAIRSRIVASAKPANVSFVDGKSVRL